MQEAVDRIYEDVQLLQGHILYRIDSVTSSSLNEVPDFGRDDTV